jgi:hypothetical protein
VLLVVRLGLLLGLELLDCTPICEGWSVMWPSFDGAVSKNVGWERVFLSVDRGGSWLEEVGLW